MTYDMQRMAARVAGSPDEVALIRVSEGPNRVTVTFRGKTHSGTWTDYDEDTGDNGYVVPDDGSDETLLQAAMTVWSGEDEFEATADQLADTGYWGLRPDAGDPEDV